MISTRMFFAENWSTLRDAATIKGLAALAAVCAVGIGCTETRSVVAQETAKVSQKDLWRVHPGNPIIQAGDLIHRGLWNDPSVLRLDDGTYVIYMTSSTAQPFKPPILPFRAVSRDGIRWRLDPMTPLLNPAGTPYVNLETPSVVRYGGKWHMYFMGVLPPGSVPASHIGHAVSDDGVRWKLDPIGLKVIQATGNVNDWNGFLVSEPGAVVYNNRIYLYFAALGARPGGRPPQLMTIGLATSTDGTYFDAPRRVLLADEALFPPGKGYIGYATVSAVVHQGRMHLFYNLGFNARLSGSEIDQVALHHSVSSDGQTGWRQDRRPIFTREDFDWTNGGGIIGPTVLIEGDRVRMWFAGHSDKRTFGKLAASGWKGRQFGIGYAEAPLSWLTGAGH